jgi:hypothetical protein
MVSSDEDRGRSRRPDVEYRRWSSTGRVLGSRASGRSSDVVCGLHHARGAYVSWFGLKTKVNGLSMV